MNIFCHILTQHLNEYLIYRKKMHILTFSKSNLGGQMHCTGKEKFDDKSLNTNRIFIILPETL